MQENSGTLARTGWRRSGRASSTAGQNCWTCRRHTAGLDSRLRRSAESAASTGPSHGIEPANQARHASVTTAGKHVRAGDAAKSQPSLHRGSGWGFAPASLTYPPVGLCNLWEDAHHWLHQIQETHCITTAQHTQDVSATTTAVNTRKSLGIFFEAAPQGASVRMATSYSAAATPHAAGSRKNACRNGGTNHTVPHTSIGGRQDQRVQAHSAAAVCPCAGRGLTPKLKKHGGSGANQHNPPMTAQPQALPVSHGPPAAPQNHSANAPCPPGAVSDCVQCPAPPARPANRQQPTVRGLPPPANGGFYTRQRRRTRAPRHAASCAMIHIVAGTRYGGSGPWKRGQQRGTEGTAAAKRAYCWEGVAQSDAACCQSARSTWRILSMLVIGVLVTSV